MNKFVAIATLFALLMLAGVVALSPDAPSAIEFYGKNIRASLFTGLLTAGSFLLSLKVFIIVKFKETVFDTPAYKKRFEDQLRYEPGLRHYGQLRNLTRLLFVSIASAITASIVQMTVGLIPHYLALLTCVFIASFAAAMLFQTLLLIRVIIHEWLDETEHKPGPAPGAPS